MKNKDNNKEPADTSVRNKVMLEKYESLSKMLEKELEYSSQEYDYNGDKFDLGWNRAMRKVQRFITL